MSSSLFICFPFFKAGIEGKKKSGVSKMKELASMDEVKSFSEEPGLQFLYVLTTHWSVCHALLPQVEEVLSEFPRIQTSLANAKEIPELAGFLSIFTVPVLILFADGKEMMREARMVHLVEFKRKIGKIYEGFYASGQWRKKDDRFFSNRSSFLCITCLVLITVSVPQTGLHKTIRYEDRLHGGWPIP